MEDGRPKSEVGGKQGMYEVANCGLNRMLP